MKKTAGALRAKKSGPAGKRTASSKIPLCDVFRERILTRYWKPDERIPKETELAKEFGVCAATVQRHLKDLQREGLIYGKPGQGRFVAGTSQKRSGSKNIGFLLHDSRGLAHPRMAQMLAGVGTALAEAGYHLSIFAANQLPEEPLNLISSCGKSGVMSIPALQGVDGIIVATQMIPAQTVQQLADFIPIVICNDMHTSNTIAVVNDYISGTLLAMQHLSGLGHKTIDVITKESTDAVGRAVRDGVRLAAQTLPPGRARPDILVHTESSFSREEGFQIMEKIFSSNRRPTALFCEDQTAQGVLDYADIAGLKIPDDFSLVSWNHTLVDRKPVGITSVCFDEFTAGTIRARKLLKRINDPLYQPESEFLTPVLEIGQSTAAPAKNKRIS